MKKFYILIPLFSAFLLGCEENRQRAVVATEQTADPVVEETKQEQEVIATPPPVIDDVYSQVELAFIGNPPKSATQPVLEAVLEKSDLPITDENISKTASCLVALRKESKRGVTEMQIADRMLSYGKSEMSLPERAGIAFTILESQ